MSLNEIKDRDNLSARDISIFYRNGIIICAILFAVMLLLRTPRSNLSGPFESHSEELWTVVCTSFMVPFVAEYLLDVGITTFMPEVQYPHAAEDKLGHGLILFSLIPCSHISIWVFEETFPQVRVGLIGFSHTLFVCGVLGKLLSFGPRIWNKFDMEIILLTFSIAQVIILFKNWLHIFAFVSVILKLLCTMKFLQSSQNLFNQEDIDNLKPSGQINTLFFTSNLYLCWILTIGMVLFLSFSTYITWRYLHFELSSNRFVELDLIIHLIGVLILTVLPGRVLRRGLAAVEYLQQLQKELNSKKTFIRYISHEIRSPLSTTSLGIDCIISLLQAQNKHLTHLETELFDLAKDSKVTCAAAIHTLNDLLLFDKIENNMLQLDVQDVKSFPFFEDSIHPFIRQLSVAGIDFQVYFDSLLKNVSFNVDQFKLEQVVRNFISNAIKFTPVGGKITVNILVRSADFSNNGNSPAEDSLESNIKPKIESNVYEKCSLSRTPSITAKLLNNKHGETNITIQTTPSAEIIRFEVLDTGTGISKENQQKLFQQYVQFNAAKLQGGKGSGLGLWISKAIVDKLGGHVGAYSEGEGKGSMFFFELPCYKMDESALTELDDESVKSTSSPPVSPLSIPSVIPDTLARQPSVFTISQEKLPADENSNSSSCSGTLGEAIEDAGTNIHHSVTAVIPRLELPSTITHIQSADFPCCEEFSLGSFDSTDSQRVSSSQGSISNHSKASLTTNNCTLATPRSLFLHGSNGAASPQKRQPQSPASTNSLRCTNSRSSSSKESSVAVDGFNSSRIGGHQLKILLADDAVLSRKMVDRLLQPLHATCIHATNGREAVDAVVTSLRQNEAIPFDVVIIDFYMPELNGPEAIHAMRKADFRGLICAVTGSTSATDHEQLLVNGANVIMSKPFNVKIFQQALREYLKHAK